MKFVQIGSADPKYLSATGILIGDMSDINYEFLLFDRPISGEYVPRAVLEETLNKADVVISPMQVKYRSVTVEEIYTVTKGTGIFSDVIKCAKPTIVPHTYQLADEIKGSFLTYGDEKELQRLLEDLIEDRERLKNLKKEAIKTSEQFSLARLHESFDKMVGELLDGS